jgi:hypothetical protein
MTEPNAEIASKETSGGELPRDPLTVAAKPELSAKAVVDATNRVFSILPRAAASLLALTAMPRKLQIWATIWLAAAIVAHWMSDPDIGWFQERIEGFLGKLTAVCWAISAGVTVAELIARISQRGAGEEFYQWQLINWVLTLALLSAPRYMGQSQARIDALPSSTNLPVARLSVDDGHKWNLVGPIGDKFLLVTLAATKTDRRFRVVEQTDLIEVDVAPKPAPTPK